MVESKIVGYLKTFSSVLRKQGIRVNKIVLYGSYASGNYRKDSDIDVAVISSNFGKNRYKEGSRLFEIASRIDPRIEPVPISDKSYKKDTWIPLIHEIRKNGVVIPV